MLSLETKRLIIRELTAADFDDYFTICHQKEIHPYLSHITTNRDVEYAREELEFNRITAVIAPDNKASVRLAGKLGFTFVKDTVYQNQTCRLYVNEEGTEA